MRRDEWTAGIVRDPMRRAHELRLAVITETVFSLASAFFVLLAVWLFLGDVDLVGGLAPARAGGMALLCLVGCMAIAAGGGIKRRLILLARELDSRDEK